MEDVAQGKFHCDGCGKSYKWKPELAGKKAKCKCGHVMTVPAAMPGGDDLEDGLYALAEEATAKKSQAVVDSARCPGCGSPMEAGAAICVSCGFNIKSGRRLATQAVAAGAPALAGGAASAVLAYAGGGAFPGAARTDAKDEIGDNNLIDYYIPLALIAFGLIFSIVQTMNFTKSPVALGVAVIGLLLGTFLNMIFIGIGCLLAIKVMDVAFGAPLPALVKLTAIALAPGAIADCLAYFSGSFGLYVGWAVQFILYLILLSYLFELDGGETMMLACIIIFVRWFVSVVLMVALLALLFGGRGSGLVSTLAGSGGSVSSKQDVEQMDSFAEDALGDSHYLPAREWLTDPNDRTPHVFGNLTHDQSLQIAQNLHDMGAVKISAYAEGSYAENLIIELPPSKQARKKIFEWYKQNQATYGWEDEKDVGQKYLTVQYRRQPRAKAAAPSNTSNDDEK